MADETWEVDVHYIGGGQKVFTGYSKKDAYKDAKKFGKEGVFESEANGDGWFYYPPHQINFIRIKKEEI